MALLASNALAAVATTAAATPTSFSAALATSLGDGGGAAFTEVATRATAAAPEALRPVNEGMATAAEATEAISFDSSESGWK